MNGTTCSELSGALLRLGKRADFQVNATILKHCTADQHSMGEE